MGMESYYVNLVPTEVKMVKGDETYSFVGKSNKEINELVITLKEGGYLLVKKDDFLYELDNVLSIRFSCEDSLVKTMAIQGCFTWFEDGVKLIYNLSNYINKEVMGIYVNFAFGEDFDITNETDFCKRITEGYKEKFEEFSIMYGTQKIKQSVREFYSKRNKTGGTISKIKKLLGITSQ